MGHLVERFERKRKDRRVRKREGNEGGKGKGERDGKRGMGERNVERCAVSPVRKATSSTSCSLIVNRFGGGLRRTISFT